MGVDVSSGIAYGVKVSQDVMFEGLKRYILSQPEIEFDPYEDDIEEYQEYLEDNIICLDCYSSNSDYIIGIDLFNFSYVTVIEDIDTTVAEESKIEFNSLMKIMYPDEVIEPKLLGYIRWY